MLIKRPATSRKFSRTRSSSGCGIRDIGLKSGNYTHRSRNSSPFWWEVRPRAGNGASDGDRHQKDRIGDEEHVDTRGQDLAVEADSVTGFVHGRGHYGLAERMHADEAKRPRRHGLAGEVHVQ